MACWGAGGVGDRLRRRRRRLWRAVTAASVMARRWRQSEATVASVIACGAGGVGDRVRRRRRR
eukprot:1428082-Pleurochrysis_carterae.AAC.1